MKWNNLKNYKCPKCSGGLHQDHISKLHCCNNFDCDFKIGERKLSEIISSGNRPRYHTPTEDENLAELNNL